MDYSQLSREELIRRLQAAEAASRVRESLAGSAEWRHLHELEVQGLELEAQNQALREAQGEVEQSRARYADLFDFAPIPYFSFDRSGRVVEVNLTGATLLGHERSQIVGRLFSEFTRFDDSGGFASHLQRCLESPAPVAAEVAFAVGSERYEFQVVSSAARQFDARATCRSLFLDITRRRLADREARLSHSSEIALRRRIERVDAASAAVTAELAAVGANDVSEVLRVVLREARAIVDADFAAIGLGGDHGRPFEPWLFEGFDEGVATQIGRSPRGVGLLGTVLHTGRAIRLTDMREHPTFRGFPPYHPEMKSFLGVPIRYQGQSRGELYLANKVGGHEFTEDDQAVLETLANRVGIAMEIAQLRQLEQREHARLALLAKTGPLLAEAADFDATLRAVARLVVPSIADTSVLTLLDDNGLPGESIVFHPDREKRLLIEEHLASPDGRQLSEPSRTAVQTGRPQRCAVQVEVAGQASSPCQSLLPRLDVKGYIVAPLAVRGRVFGLLRIGTESARGYTDDDLQFADEIAHHASLALEVAKQHGAARAALGARDNLLAVVSHDLRNYLSTVNVCAEILAKNGGPAGASGDKYIAAIRRAAQRMDQLIASLRDATMIETGQFGIDPAPEDVASLVDEACRTFEAQAEARSLRLRPDVRGDPGLVACDRGRILQVLGNLLGNAIKFTDHDGGIEVRAERADGQVCFAVSDTGAGIPERDLAHVFERHFRAGEQRGSGLGLFIAKGIVEAHGGALSVESRIGKGTTFRFSLPVPRR